MIAFSMQKVGERAGYSGSLPSHYFGKKEDLLTKVAMLIISPVLLRHRRPRSTRAIRGSAPASAAMFRASERPATGR